MKWRHVLGGAVGLTSIGLMGALIGIGVQNTHKPAQIDGLKSEIQSTMYPTIPSESRLLPKTGPAHPSPGVEN